MTLHLGYFTGFWSAYASFEFSTKGLLLLCNQDRYSLIFRDNPFNPIDVYVDKIWDLHMNLYFPLSIQTVIYIIFQLDIILKKLLGKLEIVNQEMVIKKFVKCKTARKFLDKPSVFSEAAVHRCTIELLPWKNLQSSLWNLCYVGLVLIAFVFSLHRVCFL